MNKSYLFNKRLHVYSLYFLDDTIIEPYSVRSCRDKTSVEKTDPSE